MTDNTQPETGGIHIIRSALELGLLWIDGDGRDKVREALDALDALEAQLDSIGAGGASVPLIGRAADHFEDKLDMVARWYMVDKDGMATLCTDREDAEHEAKDADMAWPHTAPHRAVQLVEVASLAASAGSEPVAGMNEYGVRGYLAATLKCWHRLTGDEAAELVAMTQRLSGLYTRPSPPEGMVGGWNGGSND